MKQKVYSAVILLSLASPTVVVAAEEPAEVRGQVGLGGMAVHTSGDTARLQEFRALDDAVIGNIQLDALKGAYHFELDAARQGEDDQFLQLRGGEYDNFKYKFNYNEMSHNYGFDAISPATGIGTTSLVFPPVPPPATPLSQWTHFDYSVDHKTYGGELEVSLHSPFYVKVGVERREENGLRPYSIGLPTETPAEVPQPVSTRTNNVTLSGGYLGASVTAALSGMVSAFNNDNKFLSYDDGTGAGIGPLVDRTAAFAPDNHYKKMNGELTWRALPLASVLAVGGSYTHLTNSYSVADLNLNNTAWPGAAGFTSLNRTTFDGDIDYTNASLSLASRPMDKLDTKVYYRYLDRDNHSSIISYDIGGATANSDGLMSYQKDDAGIDLGYRLPNKTKAEGGYEYLKINRSTPDGAPVAVGNSTRDNVVYIGLKNSALDWLTAKVRYKHVKRDSDTINMATTPFYYQDQSSDEWKVGLDFFPADTLDLGLSVGYKHINYDQSVDTRQDDKRKNIYLDATWRANKIATLTGFLGYEAVKTKDNRAPNDTGGSGDSAISTTTPYSQTNKDNFWTYGLAAKIAATEKLTLDLSGQYQKSDGQLDFSNPNFLANTQSDNYSKSTLEAKASYAIGPKLKMTVGYLYEKFKYEDVNYAGYSFQPDPASNYYYSGLYANQNYDANVVYVMAAYGF